MSYISPYLIFVTICENYPLLGNKKLRFSWFNNLQNNNPADTEFELGTI